MITTSNLGLVVWDSEEDDFEHSALADNFVRIDAHDHEGGLSEPLSPPGPEGETGGYWTSLGLGLPIGTASIKPGAIWRYLLAQRAVGHLQIAKKGVESENIAEYAVENEHVADEAIDDRTIEDFTITIDKLDPNILKLGTTLLWYKATPEEEPGDLWEVCDGRNWSEIENAWGLSVGKIPDMRERFARGTTLANIGETGGVASVDLAHAHHFAASSINHSHVVPGHNHTIGPDGLHNHEFEYNNETGTIRSRQNAFIEGLTLEGHENLLESAYVGIGSLDHDNERVPGFDVAVPMTKNGVHSHGGATGISAAFSTGKLTGRHGHDRHSVGQHLYDAAVRGPRVHHALSVSARKATCPVGE